ncbi:MAG TPA: carboxypeptidase-like regulatory domain-containing protein, partial [Edaphobacter sp.]
MKKALVCSLILLLSPLFLGAQISNNTSLVGTVLDPTGGAVSGAKVTAIEQATNVRYSATTNGDGYYAITFIKSGTYNITVEQTGFKKAITLGVPVAVDVVVRTDFNLNVGSVAEEVTVSASTPPISTDDANLGETFATRQVNELPINGRNALEIAALASNVTVGVKTSYSGNPPGMDFNGAGQRETQNSIT